MHSCSGNLATMACGMPYAIAAQIAFPDRQVIGVIGDGGFTMLMGEIITAVAYKLPIKLVIIKNNTLGQIKWEQMVFQGNPDINAISCRSTSSHSRRRSGQTACASTTTHGRCQVRRSPCHAGPGYHRGRCRSIHGDASCQDHRHSSDQIFQALRRRANRLQDRTHGRPKTLSARSSECRRYEIRTGTARAYTIPTDAPEADGTIAGLDDAYCG